MVGDPLIGNMMMMMVGDPFHVLIHNELLDAGYHHYGASHRVIENLLHGDHWPAGHKAKEESINTSPAALRHTSCIAYQHRSRTKLLLMRFSHGRKQSIITRTNAPHCPAPEKTRNGSPDATGYTVGPTPAKTHMQNHCA
jgi:hypothetical protein